MVDNVRSCVSVETLCFVFENVLLCVHIQYRVPYQFPALSMVADQMAVTLEGTLALRTEGAVLIQRHLQYHKAPHIPNHHLLPSPPPPRPLLLHSPPFLAPINQHVSVCMRTV